MNNFTDRIKAVIKAIPAGKVGTYGQVASMAGNHRAARQVSWVLHSSSEKDNLPWQRVINRNGQISLPPGEGYHLQKQLLNSEGVVFDTNDRIDLKRFLWNPE
ncbi:MAG: MGMT family protein [bacterium]|nr:MGMT family protein [bacterium]